MLAILEACLAATAALFVFFRYRSHWEDSFVKRGLSSLVLAAAVLGMHHIGLAGTSWTFRADRASALDMLHGRRAQSIRLTIAIAVMCLVIILISVSLAVLDNRVRRQTSKDARQIVVASAAFDKFGRVLVKLNGSLPFQVIETDAVLKDMIIELDPRRPTFQWLFRLSFDWSIVTAFLPLIAQAVQDRRNKSATGKSTSSSPKESKSFYGRNGTRAAAARAEARKADELRAFKARFIEATYELAQELEISLEDVGVMFDQTLLTGTVGVPTKTNQGEKQDEAEVAIVDREEGIMLVVVRELTDDRSVAQYLEKGYRFAETKHFSGVFSDRVGVPRAEMDGFLSNCKTFAKRGTRPVVQPGGAYVGLFGIRPTGQEACGIEILSYAFAKHQIPAYRLPDVVCPLAPDARNFLRSLSGLTIGEVLARCDDEISQPVERSRRRSNSVRSRSSRQSKQWSDDESDYEDESSPLLDFQIALSIAIEALGAAMVGPWPEINDLARLSPEILNVPSSEGFEPAQLIVLEVVLPRTMHVEPSKETKGQMEMQQVGGPTDAQRSTAGDPPPAPFTFTPFSLFSSAQTMMIRGQGAESFSKDVIQQLCADYSVKVPANLHSRNSSTHPYDSTHALTNASLMEVSPTGTAVPSVDPTKEPSHHSAHPNELQHPPAQDGPQLTGRASSLPSNSQTALPLSKAPVSTTNLATYAPSVPRRSASLVHVNGESTASITPNRDSSSVGAGRHGARTGGMVGGRVAVGGSDGSVHEPTSLPSMHATTDTPVPSCLPDGMCGRCVIWNFPRRAQRSQASSGSPFPSVP